MSDRIEPVRRSDTPVQAVTPVVRRPRERERERRDPEPERRPAPEPPGDDDAPRVDVRA